LVNKLVISIVLAFVTSLTSSLAQSIYLEHIVTDINSITYTNNKIDPSHHSNLQSLINERNKVLDSLHRNGYLNAHYKDLKKKNDSTYASYIYIGDKIDIVIIQINARSWPKVIKNAISLDKSNQLVVPIEKLEAHLMKLKNTWENQGYSFVKVKLKNFKSRKDTLFTNLSITKNGSRKIDSIEVKGYKEFPKKILRHRFGLKKNKLLSKEQIAYASDAIEATGIARQTRNPEILYEKNKSTIFLYLEKLNNNYFDGIIGFTTQETTGKLEFSGNLNLSLHNNLNKGERLTLSYLADGRDQKEVNIELETPYIGNTPVSISGGIHIFKKDSSYTTTSLNTKVMLDTKNWSHYIGYEKTESVNQLEQSIDLEEIKSLNGNFLYIGSSFTNYQNDLLQPINTYGNINLTAGTRVTDINRDNQIKLELEGFHNFKLAGSHSIYTKANLSKFWSNTYYINENFKIGGVQNIRGFNENSIYASQMALLQAEYRYRTQNNFYIHTISDIGWIENRVKNNSETLIGIGFGIGMHNKLGLMSIQIANGFTNRNMIDFDKTRIHISLQTKF